MLENRSQTGVEDGSAQQGSGYEQKGPENLIDRLAFPDTMPLKDDQEIVEIFKQSIERGGSFDIAFFHKELPKASPEQEQSLPVLDEISELRGNVDSFIRDNLHKQGKIGFLADNTPEFNVSDLRSSIEESLIRIRLMEDQEDLHAAVDHTEQIADVADSLDEYLTFLRLECPDGVVGQNVQEMALISLVQLKSVLAAATQETMMGAFQAQANHDLQSIQGLLDPAMLQAGGQIEIDASGTSLEAASKSAQAIVAAGEPEVLTIAKEVHAALREVTDGLRDLEPERIGFRGEVDQEPVSLSGLIEVLTEKSARLEEMFSDRSDATPPGIQLRSIAQNLQSTVDLLRIPLVRDGQDSVSSGRSGTMLSGLKGTEKDVRGLIKGTRGFLKELEGQLGGSGGGLNLQLPG